MTSHTPLDTDNWQYVDNYFNSNLHMLHSLVCNVL